MSHRTGTAPGPAVTGSKEQDSDADPAWLLHEEGPAATLHSDWPYLCFIELPALPAVVPSGRLHSKQVLAEWNLDHLAEDAEMLVSEMLTNAVKAPPSPQGPGLVALRLLANGERLLIEVWDRSPADPQPREPDCESESGRGFAVIEAISHRWGYRRASRSLKVVWCELLIGG
jgi:anti-sigma regulatory factor (Ser/Thr protein kinase)